MTMRLWYPQLDVFDAARRLGTLLLHFEEPPGAERLYIADFFLANPPLLHKTTMPMEMRQAFLKLSIPKPEKTFVSYPSPTLLFHKMEPIQKDAIEALLGKDLVSREHIRNGKVSLTEKGIRIFSTHAMHTIAEKELSIFLATNFAAHAAPGNSDLRSRTGLRRPV